MPCIHTEAEKDRSSGYVKLLSLQICVFQCPGVDVDIKRPQKTSAQRGAHCSAVLVHLLPASSSSSIP